MNRKTPKQCPKCKSKQLSYENDEVEILRDDNGKDIVHIESEWTCMECDEIFYYHARHELGNLISESTST